MTYRGYEIEYQRPPVPSSCGCDFAFWIDGREEDTTRSANDFQDAKDQIDEILGDCPHEDTDGFICPTCMGSGEGMHEGNCCMTCKGIGTSGLFCVDCGETMEVADYE